jgi:hypothetical protein
MNILIGNKYCWKSDGEVVTIVDVIELRDTQWRVVYEYFNKEYIVSLTDFINKFTPLEEYKDSPDSECNMPCELTNAQLDELYEELHILTDENLELKRALAELKAHKFYINLSPLKVL